MNKYSNKKIVWHPEKLQSFRTGNITAPIYVRIKPTNRCNHSCHFCVYGSQIRDTENPKIPVTMHDNIVHKDQLSREELKTLIDDLVRIGVKCVTFSGGGEPLLHPDIVEVIDFANTSGLKTSIITNGSLLSGDRARVLGDSEWVRVSMDYSNAEEFKASRGCGEDQFNKIINNMREFKSNYRAELTVNYIVTRHNWKTILKACELLQFVDNIRFSPVWTADQFGYHWPFYHNVKEEIRYAQNKFKTKIYDGYNISKNDKERKIKSCYFWQISPVVGADGKIYACHNKAYANDAIVGDIREGGFEQAWFRSMEKMSCFDAQKTCKCQCANESKNIFINELLESSEDSFV